MPPGLSTIIHLPLTISFHSLSFGSQLSRQSKLFKEFNLKPESNCSLKPKISIKDIWIYFVVLYRTLVTKHDLLHKMGLIGTGRLLPSQHRISGRTCFDYESVSVLLRPIWHFMSLKVLLSLHVCNALACYMLHFFLHNINNRHCHWGWNFLKYFFFCLNSWLKNCLSCIFLKWDNFKLIKS